MPLLNRIIQSGDPIRQKSIKKSHNIFIFPMNSEQNAFLYHVSFAKIFDEELIKFYAVIKNY